ncbi:hypothetical protein [Streptomyces liliifuscus]|uniref:Uncharacterized protein n=1 Tax=Streptomyces liliifuscus TaxID=2797636 RepID=A0A7T7L2A3_9ACTN|nr:hypothetical protein [Streptomyces liliifuscus]QQM45138.1 hypothetical protein JEQ17_40905 [Streptomyces liliifuscus]
MTSPAQELRTAAQTLLDHADATAEDIETNTYWHSQIADREHWYAHGIDNALGGPAGKLAGLLSPATARELAGAFRTWARMGDLDPDLLHRIGGPETLATARAINAGSQP